MGRWRKQQEEALETEVLGTEDAAGQVVNQVWRCADAYGVPPQLPSPLVGPMPAPAVQRARPAAGVAFGFTVATLARSHACSAGGGADIAATAAALARSWPLS